MSDSSKPQKLFKLMKYLLHDSTIDKASSDRTKADRMIQVVSNKQNLLYSQRNVRNITQKRRELQETWEEMISKEIDNYFARKKNAEKAAVKIQKIVRGFLVRIKIEPLMLTIREKNNSIIIKELRKQTDYCMLTLGTNTIPVMLIKAIKMIQASYRRYVLRKKLLILGLAYKQYLVEREEMICNFLRQVFRNYNCKLKRDHLAFLQYRVNRMEQIKEKIAILTIKKIWKDKKWSFKIVKEKFIRIKRRKAAMQNKEAYQKYLASIGGSAASAKKDSKKLQDSSSKDSKQMSEPKRDEDGNEIEKNPEDDEEYKEAQRIKDIIDRTIRAKVAKGKLAYSIKSPRAQTVCLPMMQEKALIENLDEGSKLMHITMSVFAKGRSLSRENRPKTRNFSICTPQELNQRRHHDFQLALPRLSVYTPADIPFETPSSPYIPEIEHAHFLMETVSSANKTGDPVVPRWKAVYFKTPNKKHRKIRLRKDLPTVEGERITKRIVIKERKPHWIPVARPL